MDLAWLLDWLGEPMAALAGGVVVGALFGAFGQQSRFCLRAATVEFSRGRLGGKTAVWLLTFSAAVLATQLLWAGGAVDLAEARQLAVPQSLSGAAIGGLMFGSGMVLARGCASRLLILSATGNLRALLSGMVFAVVAQASLRGFLAPLREWVAGGLTTASTNGNDMIAMVGVSRWVAIAFIAVWFAAGILAAVRNRIGLWPAVAAALTGVAIPLAWWFNASLASQAFEPVQVQGITFTGPSADALMLFLDPPSSPPDFGIGLVIGVFAGAFLAAAVTRELKWQTFDLSTGMRRYLVGAALMGFGGMLAGGCAVGAGVTGGSVFALTAWVTLLCIWIAAGLTDWLVDRGAEAAATEPVTPKAALA